MDWPRSHSSLATILTPYAFADLAQSLCVRADDGDYLVDWRSAQVVEDRFYDRPSSEFGEQLPAPEPAPAPRGQHDRRYSRRSSHRG